ncbi:MAG: SufD family Fe-S cluster assembly protein [Patescibacteria group bacterium]|jgi:Fe-S cluster assembly protein SufD
MKKLIIKKDRTIELEKVEKPGGINIVIQPGVKGNLIFRGGLEEAIVTVMRGAVFNLFCLMTDLDSDDSKIVINLIEPLAQAHVHGIFHGQQEDKHFFNIIMHHQAKETKGDIIIKGVYENMSRGSFSGLIKIDKASQKAVSHFSDEILLSDEAIALSVPTLEISANDVRASHRSTTSQIDEEQLFYLASRGLNQQQARQMIIKGFFKSITDKLPVNIKNKFYAQTAGAEY